MGRALRLPGGGNRGGCPTTGEDSSRNRRRSDANVPLPRPRATRSAGSSCATRSITRRPRVSATKSCSAPGSAKPPGSPLSASRKSEDLRLEVRSQGPETRRSSPKRGRFGFRLIPRPESPPASRPKSAPASPSSPATPEPWRRRVLLLWRNESL